MIDCRSVECPACGAAVGAPCAWWGAWANTAGSVVVHGSRLIAAENAAGRAQFVPSESDGEEMTLP
jgi:hypothetical protein